MTERQETDTLKVNDQVLIILPTDGNKLLMQWKGPYRVKEKLGRCDYRLDVDGKIKPFHANLLKKYVSRDRADTSGSIDVSNVRENAQGLIDVVCIGVVEEETGLQEGTGRLSEL